MANIYSKRFNKVLKEQDESDIEDVEMTDSEAMDAELSDITSDELGADVPEGTTDSPISTEQKQMYDELNSWIE